MIAPIRPLAITMGEPAGVGGEIVVAAWKVLHASGPAFFALDDPDRLRRLVASFGWSSHIVEISQPGDAPAAFARGLPVLPRQLPSHSVPGTINSSNSLAVISSIEDAVALAHKGEASGIVTNPIQKSALYAAGFRYPGHTEFLAEIAGDGSPVIMMLVGGGLRVVPVTIHEPIKAAIGSLTTNMIVETAQATAFALKRDFGLISPRLAIAGLNPHAGEGGTIGREDIEIVQPAVDALKASGIDVKGPMPPCTMFTPRARQTYDAAICLYHDQALIPLKSLDPDGGVNVTLGLSIIRTSPDHGTALDIAGQGVAHPGSMIAAIRLAAEMAQRRALSRPGT